MEKQKTEETTKEWYKEYYLRKGTDRNDILMNSGVLFQTLAFQKSLCAHNSETTLPKKLESNIMRAEEKW
jgi:hypothetical protein